jgi:hypothetical protein
MKKVILQDKLRISTEPKMTKAYTPAGVSYLI